MPPAEGQDGATRRDEAWRHQPPYGGFDAADRRSTAWTGQCHCGAVKYELCREQPLNAKFCHCATCQKMHGAPFQWSAIFDKADIRFLNGADGLRFYHTATREPARILPCKVSCALCLSPIMDEGRRMCMLLPSTVDFEGKQAKRALFEPSCHIEYDGRSVEIRDGRPKYAGLDEKSAVVHEGEAGLTEGTIPLFPRER
ncbi:hypothetical protein KEM52_005512 [Ascosphaera acerosa]|nr:hypothetical protein KEM52_005512 [Ascosphaera acerosa]